MLKTPLEDEYARLIEEKFNHRVVVPASAARPFLEQISTAQESYRAKLDWSPEVYGRAYKEKTPYKNQFETVSFMDGEQKRTIKVEHDTLQYLRWEAARVTRLLDLRASSHR